MAIRDQSYQPYDGPLDTGGRWAVIGWDGFRTYWGFWRTKLTIFAVWLIPVGFIFATIVEAALADATTPVGDGYRGPATFIGIQVFALGVVFIARGCSIISDDLRHGALQMHFAKPIDQLDYAAGKLVTLLLLGGVAVFAPAVLVAGLRTAMYVQTEAFGELAVLHLQALVMLGVVVVLMSSLVLGLSSLTRRGGYVVLGWIGVLVVPLIAQSIVALTTGSDWAAMLSINGIVALATEALLGGAAATPEQIPAAVPFVAIAAMIAAGLAAVAWRMNNLQRTT